MYRVMRRCPTEFEFSAQSRSESNAELRKTTSMLAPKMESWSKQKPSVDSPVAHWECLDRVHFSQAEFPNGLKPARVNEFETTGHGI